jgi:biotin transport system substrate-specific component
MESETNNMCFATKYRTYINTILCVLILTISARVTLGLGISIPLTLQTYALGLIIVLAHPKVSVYSIFTYVILGVIGVPVFSHGSHGINVIYGATGGYIIGFLVAALCFYIIKTKSKLNPKSITILIWALIMHAIIILCGFVRLVNLVGYSDALHNGLLPLILPATIKSVGIFATYLVYVSIRKKLVKKDSA